LSLGIVVAGKSGYGYPSGKLSLQEDGQPITTYVFDGGTGTLNPSTLTLNYGEKSALLTGGPACQSSTISYVVPTDKLGAGTHQLQASYPGDSSFGGSHGGYSYTVTQAQSFFADFFPLGTQVAGVPVKLAGQIAFTNNGFAPYNGTITVTDVTGGTPVVLGVGNVDSTRYGGYYEVTVTVKGPGKHILRLNFSGDKNVKPSSGTYNVDFPANSQSATSLTANQAGGFAGSAITFTASVSSDVRSHPATGRISFLDGTTVLGTAVMDATGTAVFVTKTLTAGPHQITANYAGDSVLTSSVSTPVSEMISDYVVQALPSTLSIDPGESGATTTLNLIPVGGFAQTIHLTCDQVPGDTTCSFSQTHITLDGVHPATVKLLVNMASKLESRQHHNQYTMNVTTTSVAGTIGKITYLTLKVTK
jgi:hypothetical protein